MEDSDRISDNEIARQDELAVTQKKTPQERVQELEHAVRGFRIESSGDGILRGGFPKLPTGVQDMNERMANLAEAMEKFNLTGDGLTVSGSFNKGYSVSRENPCEQQQVNEPT